MSTEGLDFQSIPGMDKVSKREEIRLSSPYSRAMQKSRN